jgi:hypothetical protein
MPSDTDVYFYETEEVYTKSDVIENFLPRSRWKWVPYIHACINCEVEPWRDTFVSAIDQKFNGKMHLFKIPAKSRYRWHRDVPQQCSINMVLNEYNSHTVFATNNEIPDIFYFTELKYKPLRWYLFNTQQLHSVSNYGDEDRILVSYRFDRSVTYKDLLFWYLNEYIVSKYKK